MSTVRRDTRRHEKSSRAERQDRRTSNDGLEGAVAASAAAVTGRTSRQIRTPTASASPPKNNGSSANSSPMKKNISASSNQRVRRAEVSDSSSSEDGSDEDEWTMDGMDDDSDTDDVEHDEKKETKKPKKKKVKKSEQQLSGHFSDSGDMHLLIRRAMLYWNCSANAADIADAPFHQERLNGALAAVQATNIQGLRETASTIFEGEFMRKKLAESASTADKVNTLTHHDASCRRTKV